MYVLRHKLIGRSLSLVRGVGHNPDSLAEVRRSNIGSGYNLPFGVIPGVG
jgi:hypothetical protein